MTTTTTFLTATGTTWSLTGVTLARHHDVGPDGGDRFEAVPNSVGRNDGMPYVAVNVNGTITFVDRGLVKTTGRITQVVRVASVDSSAA